MKPIKFTENDGSQLLLNPAHITDVKVIYSDYHSNWCLVLNVNRGNGTVFTHTKVYDTEAGRSRQGLFLPGSVSVPR